MADVIVERQTYILVSENDTVLYPSDELFPNNGIYPTSMQRIDNIVAGSMSISEILSESTLQFGQIFATKFECTIYDADSINNKYITVIQYEGNNYNIIFTGIVQSCKLDRLGTDRQVVAYDYAYSKSFLNVADWYNTFWNTHTTATLKQLRNSLLQYGDVEYVDKTLPNDNVQFIKTVNINSISFCAMLKMICELSACFPHFNRRGVLEFITLNSATGHNIDNDDYEGENSTFEEYTSDPFTGVQLYTADGTIVSTYGTNENPYSISENVLLYGLEDQVYSTIAQNILSAIQMLVYRPSSLKMIVSNFDYGVGDYIVTTKGFFYVLKMDFSGSQLIEQTMRAEGKKSSDEIGLDLDVVQTVIEDSIDELNEAVDDIYEAVDENGERMDEYEEEIEEVWKHIDTGDGYIRSLMAETTGHDVWLIEGEVTGSTYTDAYGNTMTVPTQQGAEMKYNITITYRDYGEPYAVYQSSEKHYSNQGKTISDVFDVAPNAYQKDSSGNDVFDKTVPSDTDTNYDLDHYFMDGSNGDIYQYVMEKKTVYKSTGKSKTKTGTKVVWVMKKIADGVVSSTDYDWDIFPYGADIGDYYIDLETGKIYLLEGTQSSMHWTYKYQCPSTKAIHETMIEQTASTITLEASARSGEMVLVNSRVDVTAHKISMTTSGSGQTAGITIQLCDEWGQPLANGQSNITLTGLVEFQDLSGTGGSTFINGGNIQTNTINVNTLKANSDNDYGAQTVPTIQFSNAADSSVFFSNLVIGATSNTITAQGGGAITPASNTLGLIASDNIRLQATPFPQLMGGGTQIDIGYMGSTNSSVGSLTPYTSPNSGGATAYCDSTVSCNVPFKYPIFRFLQSDTSNANVRCRNTNFGTTDSYTFAPISQSSQRWKHDIKPIQDESIDPHKLYDLEVSQFIFNLDYLDSEDIRFNTIVPGFIAEKVAMSYPIAAERDSRTGEPSDWNERFLIPPMLKLIQEQNQRITALEDKIKQLIKED